MKPEQLSPLTGPGPQSDESPANHPIGFIDSGIGGLPYLERTRELLPDERFVYLADREHFPYGDRPRDEVRGIVFSAVDTLMTAYTPGLVVIACNTASVVSLAELRENFNVPFVGVVPAIKPAGETAPSGRIAVLATERTVEDRYVADLAAQFAPGSQLIPVAAGRLVEFVENRLDLAGPEEIRAAVESSVDGLRESSPDVVVLGCTHFVHLREEIARVVGRDVPVLDSVEGVARQIVRVSRSLPGSSPTDAHGPPGKDVLIVTGGVPGEHYERLARRYRMQLVWTGDR